MFNLDGRSVLATLACICGRVQARRRRLPLICSPQCLVKYFTRCSCFRLLPRAGSLKSKTRLLVTNQLQYLPRADQVIYLEDGRVAAQGRYEEVLKNANFASLLNEFNSRGGADSDAEEVDANPAQV